MVVSISVICIMLFFTLCLLSSTFTIKNYFNNSINKYAPADFELIKYYYNQNKVSDEDMLNLINNDIELKNNINLTIINEYYDENMLYKESLGNYYLELKNKSPFANYNSKVEIISQSDYNKISKLFNLDEITLKDNEYVIVSNYEKEIYDEVMNRKSIINIFGKELTPALNKSIEGFVKISGNPTNMGFFVVPNNVIDSNSENNKILIGNYSTTDKDKINYIENKLKYYSMENGYDLDTKNDIKAASIGLSVIVTFIGLYLGIIFLISSSAILALKELSDCLDDKNKYKVLRQIGSDEKDINKALFKQTLIFFITPLSLAIIHTIFGLKFCTYILSSLGIKSILDGSIITFIFLIIIYSIYFIVTYLCSKNIIKEKM